jgi:hypothetical protein
VYAWLADEGHFIRTAPVFVPRLVLYDQDGWCSTCGFRIALHPSVADTDTEEASFECDIVPSILQHRKLPIQDISELLPAREHTASASSTSPGDAACFIREYRPRDIVRAAGDPTLIASLRSTVSGLHLPTFEGLKWTDESDVAPYAVLTIAMKAFIKKLVEGGMIINARDMELAKAFGVVKKKKSQKAQMRLLTPVQVLTGVVDEKDKGDDKRIIYEALSRIGIAGVASASNNKGDF